MTLSFSRSMVSAAVLAVGACAGQRPDFVKSGQSVFEPEKFFTGRTHSWGVFEDRSGGPKEVIETETVGTWDGNVLRFEQDMRFGSGREMHRSWRVRRVDDRHYEATGTGIAGTARGERLGGAFHLEFTLDAWPGNPLGHVKMSQWMYLQPDGVTMLNRATISKAGVTLTALTEQFQKERRP